MGKWWQRKKSAPEARIELESVVALPGSTVVLRIESLSPAQREALRSRLADLNKTGNVRFVAFEGKWDACVIGARE